jgi:hypothetical protein
LHWRMSDYLDNLIAKSFGLAEVVAPRPTSLFEPLMPDAGPLVHEHYSLEQDGSSRHTPAGAEPVPGSEFVMDVAAPLQSEDVSSEDAPPQPRAAQSDQLSQHSVQSTVQSVDRGASRPESLLIPNRPVAIDAGRSADRVRSAAPATQQPADRQTAESRPAAQVHAQSPVVSHATTPAERLVPGAPEAEPFTPAQGRAAPITPSSRSGPMLVTPTSLRRVGHEGGSPSSDSAAIPAPAPDAAAPTIKITIGRVDVRAVTPDKESPRPAPPARNQALTLEEYLKRRSGGKI